jgi:DUSAM domain-containing protein
MTDDITPDWGPLRELAQRVLERGDALELNDRTRMILDAAAREVALRPHEVEAALNSVSTAATLLQDIWRRIEDGEERLSDAHFRAYRLRDQGDFPGARKVMEDLLELETVPLYRRMAQTVLANLTRLEAVATRGHVEADFQPWQQLRILARRVQHGHPLVLREDLRGFLRQTAPSLAFSEAEADEALTTVEGAQALLAEMVKRIDDGRQRITQALSRMMERREAGDRDGALQALREVLAVERVPTYRQMAEECLATYDEPFPER